MKPAAIVLTAPQARRFLLRAHGLRQPFETIAQALQHLGCIQIDPINVCGRMHDLILRNRVCCYRENGLHDYLYGTGRPGFEQYLPDRGILVALPVEAWPFLLPGMMARRQDPNGYGGRLSPEEGQIAQEILDQIKTCGPIKAEDVALPPALATTAWGSRASRAKVVLEKLHLHGRVVIAGRVKFRRIYDLPERVIPPAIFARNPPEPSQVEHWLARLRLRQWRLTSLSHRQQELLQEHVYPVKIDGLPTRFILRSDLPMLEECLATPQYEDAEVRLLAPLDPLIYDRKMTRVIWDFDYTWEVYTPAPKRKRGYYALPVLSGDQLVGHVEPRADRRTLRLTVAGRRVSRGHVTTPAVRQLAAFLGLR